MPEKNSPQFQTIEATEDLIQAASGGFFDRAKEALKQGALVDGIPWDDWIKNAQIFNGGQRFPLIGAVVGRHEPMVGLLLAQHPKMDIQWSAHRSAWAEDRVIESLINGPEKILIQLLESGLDPNNQNDDGATLLHQAIRRSWTPDRARTTVQRLLAYGANPDLKNIESQTAEDLASMYIEIQRGRSLASPSLERRNQNSQIVLPMLRAARERALLDSAQRAPSKIDDEGIASEDDPNQLDVNHPPVAAKSSKIRAM